MKHEILAWLKKGMIFEMKISKFYKRNKRSISSILVSLLCFATAGCCIFEEVKAYEFTTNSSYIELLDKNIGQITLYVPQNQADLLQISEKGQVVNIGSSNITLYSNNYDWTFSAQPFSLIRYRRNTSSNYEYLNILKIINTNIPNLSGSLSIIASHSIYLQLGIMFMILGGVFMIWWKR